MNTKKIITIAQDVYRSLGSGHTEAVYDAAMRVGLRLAGFKYESQKVVELKYKDHYVGEGYLDIIVRSGHERLILELKATSGSLGISEENQIKHYMKMLKVRRGILLNFQAPTSKGRSKLEFKEVNR